MNSKKIAILFFVLFASANISLAQSGTLTLCSGTDDNVYALNSYTTASTSTPVYFQLQFEQPLFGDAPQTQTFIQWEVFKILANGDEKPLDEFVMTTNTAFRRYATDQPYYFKEPGKYAVYAISYYKRDTMVHDGYKEYYAKTFIDITK